MRQERMASHRLESELVQLQKTLYTSRNPTRKWLHTSRYQWVCAAIRSYAVAGGNALEVGPGSGIYLPTLAEHFSSVTAVDIEQEYLDGLAPLLTQHANLTARIDDISASSFADNSFDLILCSEVIEHISESASVPAEIHRILKPGGILILSTPQPLSPLEQVAKVAFLPGINLIVRLVYREPLLPLGHINLLSARCLQQQLCTAGFTIIEKHTGGLYLPVFSELFGQWAVTVQTRIEGAIRGTWLDFLLWTQYYVARATK